MRFLAFPAASLLVLAPSAPAAVTYLTQDRSISVETDANEAVQTIAAPNFDPFIATLDVTVPFLTPTGETDANTAAAGIDCQIDPNAIRAFGNLETDGGIGVVGGAPEPIFGEAEAFVFVTFSVDVPTPWTLFSDPRPSTNPRDEFEIELEHVATGQRLFFINEDAPAQTVNTSGMLMPGIYSLQYQVEISSQDLRAGTFNFLFTIPAPSAALPLAGLLLAARRRR